MLGHPLGPKTNVRRSRQRQQVSAPAALRKGMTGFDSLGQLAHSPTHKVEWRVVSSFSLLGGTVRWLWNSRPGNAELAFLARARQWWCPPYAKGPPAGTRGHLSPHGIHDSQCLSLVSTPDGTGRTLAPPGGSGQTLRSGAPFTSPRLARLRWDKRRELARGVRPGNPCPGSGAAGARTPGGLEPPAPARD